MRRPRKAEQAERRERRERREGAGYGPVLAIVLVLVALVGGGWAAAHQLAHNRVPHGTTLAGVDIGGMTRADAVAALRRGLAATAEEAIQLTIADGTMVHAVQIDPADAGLRIDYDASVARAMDGDSWQPSRLWDFYLGNEKTQPVVSVDQEALRGALQRVADQVGRAPRDGAVAFRRNGDLDVTHARPGQGFDLDEAVQTVLGVYLTGDAAVVPLVARPPAIDDDAVQTALDEFANPAVSASASLLFGDLRVRLFPRDYLRGLSLEPRGGRLVPTIAQSVLTPLVADGLDRGTPPVDATLTVSGGRPRVVPGRPGTVYSWASVRAAFLRAVADQGKREVAVRATPVRPSVGTADIRALDIHQRLSRVSVPIPADAAPGVDNVRGLASAVGDLVLRPGASFSLRARLGSSADASPRASAWLATAVFGAAYRAGLLDVEHHALPHWISPLPPGLDAALGEGQDLRFNDDGDHAVLLSVRVVLARGHGDTLGQVVAQVFGTPTWRVAVDATREGEATPPPTTVDGSATCTASDGVPGFTVLVTRTFGRLRGGSDHEQQLRTTYAPVPAVQCPAGSPAAPDQ